MQDRRTPPPETPGPSVNPPAEPESDTERAERAERSVPEPRRGDDPLVAEEEAAAGAEAADIGGHVPEDAGGDPAMEPVYQAGGGEQGGQEAAEAELEDHAEGNRRPRPSE